MASFLRRLCAQDEAHTCTNDSRFGHELWSLQEDGNLRVSRQLSLPHLPLMSQSSTASSLADFTLSGVFTYYEREQNLPQSEK